MKIYFRQINSTIRTEDLDPLKDYLYWGQDLVLGKALALNAPTEAGSSPAIS